MPTEWGPPVNRHRAIGSRVFVGPPYTGSGTYGTDAWSGRYWYVAASHAGIEYALVEHALDGNYRGEGEAFIAASRCFDSPEEARAERIAWARAHNYPLSTVEVPDVR